MHYYSFNIGDYKKRTDHLTDDEDLAYRRLLDLYYDTEKPLKPPASELSRRIRMSTKADVVKRILEEFFVLGVDNLWHSARCDKEISGYKAMSEGGKKGAHRRWDSPPNAPPIDTLMPTSNQEPVTSNQEPIKYINGGKNGKFRKKPTSGTEALEQYLEKQTING